MPIIKSAKKRVRVSTKATIRNVRTKRAVKTAVKNFNTQVETSKPKASAALSDAQSAIDTAVKKGVMHKNKAARKKAQLSKQAKAAGIKLAKAPAAKTPAKKATPAKAASKKPAAPKKPAVKTKKS